MQPAYYENLGEIKNKYLEKFLIYCFIYQGKPDNAILNYEILNHILMHQKLML